MIRAIVSLRWGLAALVALGTLASVAAAQTQPGRRAGTAAEQQPVNQVDVHATGDLAELRSPEGRRGDDGMSTFRLVVADGTGLAAGLTVTPVGGGLVDAMTTDQYGTVRIDLPVEADSLAFRISDASGQVWTVEQDMQFGASVPAEGVVLLQAQEADFRLFGDSMDERREHAQLLDALLQGADVEPSARELQGESFRKDFAGRLLIDGSAGSLADYEAGLGADSQPGQNGNLDSVDGGDAVSGRRTFTPRRSLGPNPIAMAWGGEMEFNDSPGECNPIDSADFGGPLTGQAISSSGDYDWYCFDANCGDVITFTATPTDGNQFRPRLEMYFDDGTAGGAALRRNFGTGYDIPTTLTEVAPMTTTYWVLVRRGTSRYPYVYPYNYDLEVSLTPGPCPVDPGEPVWGMDDDPNCNTILVPMAPSAFEESRSITWHGYRPYPNVTHQKDKDIYCVSLDCGERLSVTVTPTGGSTLVPEIRFIAPVPISGGGDPLYEWEYADVSEPFTAEIEPAVVGGLWRVEISARDNSSAPTLGDYDVSISRDIGIDCGVDEPNDAPEDCTPVALGELVPAVMFPAGDSDWFCFDIDECGQLVAIQARYPKGSWRVPPTDTPEVTLAVFDPTGQMIKAQLSLNADFTLGAGQFTSTVPGTYMARVNGTRNAPPAVPSNVITGSYEMLLTVVDPKQPLGVDVTETLSATDLVLAADATTEQPIVPVIEPGPGATDLNPTWPPGATTGSGSQLVSLPFPFNFYGEAKDSIWVDVDGWASFTDSRAGCTLFSLPNVCTPNDAIYAFRTGSAASQNSYSPDPRTYNDSRKSYEVVGTAPNREFVVTWYKRAMSGGQQGNLAGEHSFSMTLHEGTDCIDLDYGDMRGWRHSQGQHATVGLENKDGTDAMNFSSFEPKIKEGMAVTFCPDGAGNYTQVVTEPATETVPYPTSSNSCEYDIAVDSAPFVDISGSGTLVESWVVNSNVTSPIPGCSPSWAPWCQEIIGMIPQPDENYALMSLPFAFPYHGQMETDFLVFINGFLAFDETPHPNANFRSNRCDQPETSKMDGKVMPFWDDLNFDQVGFAPNIMWDGGVYTQLDGTVGSGDATYTIQWENVNTQPSFFPSGPADHVTFQAILHESGEIQFHYGDMGGATPFHRATGSSSTIGLEDRTGTSGTTYWCNDSGGDFGDNWEPGGPLHDGHRVTFTPASTAIAYEWSDADSSIVLGNDATITIPVAADMPCAVNLAITARDPNQCCDNSYTQEFITDRWAPEVDIELSPECLWSPNHKTFTMSLGSEIDIQATDNCGGTTIRLTSCSSNELDNGLGDGNTEDDCVMVGEDTVRLRSERSGRLDGRVYSIGYEVVDENGNVTAGTMDVLVPHDQSEVDCPKLDKLR